tara:strand:+ start:1389 stop:2186 length:798 start_codon:yes stop_codon:yes gene_type:complete
MNIGWVKNTPLPSNENMKKIIFLPILFLLVACGPSDEEKQNVAIITCNIISETKNMDPATKIKEMNAAREEIKGEPYLFGEDKINESLEYDLCVNLVLMSETEYEKVLLAAKEEEERKIQEEMSEMAEEFERKIQEEMRRKRAENRETTESDIADMKGFVAGELNNNAEQYCDLLKVEYEDLLQFRSYLDENPAQSYEFYKYWEYEDSVEIVDTFNENNLEQKCDFNIEGYTRLLFQRLGDYEYFDEDECFYNGECYLDWARNLE